MSECHADRMDVSVSNIKIHKAVETCVQSVVGGMCVFAEYTRVFHTPQTQN